MPSPRKFARSETQPHPEFEFQSLLPFFLTFAVSLSTPLMLVSIFLLCASYSLLIREKLIFNGLQKLQNNKLRCDTRLRLLITVDNYVN